MVRRDRALDAAPAVGTVSTSYKTDKSTTADRSDKKRGSIAVEAIKSKQYDLFLAHFFDIDMQGHSFGVKPEFNKDDTYNSAIANQTGLVRAILNAADSDTVVLITADHTHVEPGGHGGTDAAILQVPLVMYRKGSGIGKQGNSKPDFWTDAATHKNVDSDSHLSATDNEAGSFPNTNFAGMVTALLGLPTPAHSTGTGRAVLDAMRLLPNATAQHTTCTCSSAASPTSSAWTSTPSCFRTRTTGLQRRATRTSSGPRRSTASRASTTRSASRTST